MSPARSFLVTGAASGIGACLTRRLLADGHSVLAADIAEIPDLATTVAAESRLIRCALDVRDAAQWQAAVSQAVNGFGRLDVCCNVAGYLKVTTIDDMTPADIDAHIDVNVKGVMLGTHAAAAQMLRQGSGHIVNISSLAGLAPPPGLALYAGSKFAVRGFSLATAIELRKRGIDLTVVYPDAVDTPMLAVQLDRPEAALTFSGPRTLTPNDVVDALVTTVFPKRPLELGIPRSREALARFGGTLPRLSLGLEPVLRRVGLRNQAKQRNRQRTGQPD